VKIKFRLERLEVGRPMNRHAHNPLMELMGDPNKYHKEYEENIEDIPEVVRATFTRVDGEDFELLDIKLDPEVAKLYAIGDIYEVDF